MFPPPLRWFGSGSTFARYFCRCSKTRCEDASLSSRTAEEFARTPETGWAAVGAPRRGAGTTAGVLHMPPQALVVFSYIAVLANALFTAFNRLRLLALAALLGELANALDASLVKAFGTLLEAPRAEARRAATAFLQLPVRSIEGVYKFSEAFQEMIEQMGVWVSEAELQEAVLSPLPPT